MRNSQIRRLMGLPMIALVAAACASSNDVLNTSPHGVGDSLNRTSFEFNQGADKYVFHPVAKGYKAVTTPNIRGSVSNFLVNLKQPVIAANAALQGKPQATLDTTGRFLVNSSLGGLGLFDVASSFGISAHDEDFGQTLGVWGVPSGPYIVLPIVGPSTARDAVGDTIDFVFAPVDWEEASNLRDFQTGRTVVAGVVVRDALSDEIDELNRQPEPFTALRRAYLSQRIAAIRDGESVDDPYRNLPDAGAYYAPEMP